VNDLLFAVKNKKSLQDEKHPNKAQFFGVKPMKKGKLPLF
jgi:hypothetical protein